MIPESEIAADPALADLIERRLIFQEARRLRIVPSQDEIAQAAQALVPRGYAADVAGAIQEAERRLTFERMIAHWGRNVKPPKSTEVRDYYRSHREQFRRPECVHAAHLVRNTEDGNINGLRAEMETARQRLLAGEDFAALAATCSDCPENGGDLGFFARGVMVEEFDAVVFAAPVGEVTPVFETRFGVHVALVYEHRPEAIMQLTEVSGHIAEVLHRLKLDREVGRQREALRRRAVIRL